MTDHRPGRAQGVRVRAVTRERLLATAERMFLAHGFTETSIDAIAHAAGYTTGAVYSNFGGKADLFLAVLERLTAAELGAIRAALAEAGTDEQHLGAFARAITGNPKQWQAQVLATLEFLSYARQRPALHARILAAQRIADETVGELVGALCRALGIEPPESLEDVTRDITALINGLTIRSLFDDELDIAYAISSGINSLLTGDRADLRELRMSSGRTAAATHGTARQRQPAAQPGSTG
ncbi:MAG: TetR/AcrR family transcriptional regulator [Mycobacteriales bacterium]